MGALGDLLELVFDPQFICASATVTTSVDLDGRQRMMARCGAVTGVLSVGGIKGQPPPSRLDSATDVWLHRNGRFRLEYAGGSGAIGDTATQILLRPGQPALRIDGSERSGHPAEVAFQPSSLLFGYHLELGSPEVVSGRSGLAVKGRRRDGGPDGRRPWLGSIPFTDVAEFVFDPVTGVLLRLVAIDQGTTLATIEVSRLQRRRRPVGIRRARRTRGSDRSRGTPPAPVR